MRRMRSSPISLRSAAPAQIPARPTSSAIWRDAANSASVTPHDGRLVDAEGLTVEDFGLPDNLMLIHALDLHGSPLVMPKQVPADLWHDLTAFEACVRAAARRV